MPIDDDDDTPVINDFYEEELIENIDTNISTILEDIEENNVNTDEVTDMYYKFEECNTDGVTNAYNKLRSIPKQSKIFSLSIKMTMWIS